MAINGAKVIELLAKLIEDQEEVKVKVKVEKAEKALEEAEAVAER